MLWLKSLHIIFMISWFAGLFYLPRLFVHHAMSDDLATRKRLEIMERKLFWFILPWGLLTLVFGFWLISYYPWQAFLQMTWLHLKIVLAFLLVGYQYWCYLIMQNFKGQANPHTHKWFRVFNEITFVIMIFIILLVELKPNF